MDKTVIYRLATIIDLIIYEIQSLLCIKAMGKLIDFIKIDWRMKDNSYIIIVNIVRFDI